MQLHHAQWRASFLAGLVDMPQAAVVLSPESVRFDSQFGYPASKPAARPAGMDAGKEAPASVIGGLTVTAPLVCIGECAPLIELRFGALDGEAMQAALLGVPAKKTLLSPLMDRMRSTDRPKWPAVAVEAHAETLTLGAVTVHKPDVRLRFGENGVILEKWSASVLGGEANGTGSFGWGSDKSTSKPEYALKGDFSQVNTSALGSLLGARWTGKPLKGSGSIHLSGLAEKELASSAVGEITFAWDGGAIPVAELSPEPATHAAGNSVNFEHWMGKVAIKDGGAQLGENTLLMGRRKASVEGGVTFGEPVRLTLHPSAK